MRSSIGWIAIESVSGLTETATSFGKATPFAIGGGHPQNAFMTRPALFAPLVALAVLSFASLPLVAADAPPARPQLLEQVTAALRASGALDSIVAPARAALLEKNAAALQRLDDVARKRVVADADAALAEELAKPRVAEGLVAHQLEFVNDDALAALARVVTTDDGRQAAAVLLQLAGRTAPDAAAKVQPAFDVALERATAENAKLARVRLAARQMARLISGIEALAHGADDEEVTTPKYPEGPMSRLARVIEREIGGVADVDPWQKPYVYLVSSDHRHYRLVSGGADGSIDPASLDFARMPDDQASPLAGADLVVQDGSFIGAPRGAADFSEGAVE